MAKLSFEEKLENAKSGKTAPAVKKKQFANRVIVDEDAAPANEAPNAEKQPEYVMPTGCILKTVDRDLLVGADTVWGMFSEQDEDTVTDLAVSIYINGLISPIVVREIGEGKYQILAGHTRNRAYGLLKDYVDEAEKERYSSIEAFVYPSGSIDDQQAKDLYVDSNLFQRGNLPVKEQAACIEYKIQMMKETSSYGSGEVVKKLADELKMSRAEIYRWRKIANMDQDLSDALAERGINKANTLKLAMMSIEDQKVFAEKHQALILQYALDNLPAASNPTLQEVVEGLVNAIAETKKKRQIKHFNRPYIVTGDKKVKPIMVLLTAAQIEEFKKMVIEKFGVTEEEIYQ